MKKSRMLASKQIRQSDHLLCGSAWMCVLGKQKGACPCSRCVEEMDTGSVESTESPREMLICGLTWASATGANKSLILNNGCIHMEHAIGRQSLRQQTRTNQKQEWQPSGMQACHMDSPHLVIQDLTWELASASASSCTQGFVLYEKVDNTTLMGGCAVTIVPAGAINDNVQWTQPDTCASYRGHSSSLHSKLKIYRTIHA